MRKILLNTLIAALLLNACKKADELRYGSHDNIYLDLGGSDKDSLLFTFAYEPAKAADTLNIPVRISGIRQPVDRSFILRVLTDSSTAIPNTHYKPLEATYTMPANLGYVEVPLIIYNTDTTLESKSVSIRFKLFESPDFGVAIPELNAGKLVFSSKLERPNWWGMWFGDYYSRVKHQIFLITTDEINLSTEGLDAPKNLYFVGLVNSFLSDPFKWISKNPSKGYALTPRADGDYDFYNTSNPGKKTLYHKNEQAGKFFFIDENGGEVK